MSKILIFGNGQFANFYANHYKNSNNVAEISPADIRDLAQVRKAIANAKPDVVINAAAKTSLEWTSQNRLEAFDVNVLAVAKVAQACDEAGIYLIHFSSGCIFSSVDGKDAKAEEDAPDPSSYYGWTKAWSEQIVPFERSKNFQCLVLRPRQPVSAQVNHKNMLVKMLTFAKFIDTANSGTVLEDLMGWTDQLVEKRVTGVLNVANSGYTTPYNIGLMIKKHILPGLEPEKISKAELDKLTPNTRVDTVLDVTKLERLGIQVKPYEQRLEYVIQQLGKNLKAMDKAKLREELEKTAEASRQRTILNSVYPSLYE